VLNDETEGNDENTEAEDQNQNQGTENSKKPNCGAFRDQENST